MHNCLIPLTSAFPSDKSWYPLQAENGSWQDKRKKIFSVPKELFLKIICVTIDIDPSWECVGRFALVNKAAYNLVMDIEVLRQLFLQGSIASLDLRTCIAVKLLTERCASATNMAITITDSEDLTEAEAELLATACKYKKVTIDESDDSHFLKDAKIMKLISNSNHLEKLSLRNCISLTDRPIDLLSLYGTALKTLDLRRFTGISTNAIICLAESLPNLQKLSLHDGGMNDHFLELIGDKFSNSIVKLELVNAGVFSTAGMQALYKCQKLEAFYFASTNFTFTDQFLKECANAWPKLKRFDINNTSGISAESICQLMEKCQRLERLSLEDHCITFENLEALLSSENKLKALNYGFSTVSENITSDQICSLLIKHSARLVQMRELWISSKIFNQAEAKAKEQLESSLPNLNFLSWEL